MTPGMWPLRVRTMGRRRRSGSVCRCASEVPLGQRCPCDHTSSGLPRTSVTSPCVEADVQSAHRLAQRACHRGDTGHLSRIGAQRLHRQANTALRFVVISAVSRSTACRTAVQVFSTRAASAVGALPGQRGSWTTAFRLHAHRQRRLSRRRDDERRPGACSARRPAPASREHRRCRRAPTTRVIPRSRGRDSGTGLPPAWRRVMRVPRWCSVTVAASCCATWIRTTASAARWRATPTRSSSRWTTASRPSTAAPAAAQDALRRVPLGDASMRPSSEWIRRGC